MEGVRNMEDDVEARVAWIVERFGGRENMGKVLPKLTPSPSPAEIDPKADLTNYDSEEEERKRLPKIETDPAIVEAQNARLLQLKNSTAARGAGPRAPSLSMSSDYGFESVAFDERKGQPAPLELNFAPFEAVAKYCYIFTPGKWLQPFATEFFDSDKIYARDWDLWVSSHSI
jgi:hypothetical protein